MTVKVALAAVALVCISCAGARMRDGEFTGDDAAGGNGTAMEEYALLESLEDNPIDPRRATIDMLLSIPGFPPELASCVIRARNERPAGSGWLDALTPPQRTALYRFERFLLLPRKRGTRIRGRIRRDRIGDRRTGRTDLYLSMKHERCTARLRCRAEAAGTAVSPYVSYRILSSSIEVCCGDFALDRAMGLLFNGISDQYPFTSGFPLRARRSIVPAPPLSERAVRGWAVRGWHGRAGWICFRGNQRTYRGSVIETDERRFLAGMAGIESGRGRIGLSIERADSSASCAVDWRYRTGALRASLELVAAGAGAGAAAYGVSLVGDPIDAGLLVYRMPFGFENRLGAVAGTRNVASSRRRGVAAAVSGTVFNRSVLRGAFERLVSDDATSRSESECIRVESETRRRRATVRLSYRWKLRGNETMIPFPGSNTPAAAESRDAQILVTGRGCGSVQFRCSVRYSSDGSGCGYLVAPSVRFDACRSRLRFTVSGCRYQSLSGRAVFYFYEPAPEGSYPWISVRGTGGRCSVLAEIRRGGLTASLHAVWGSSSNLVLRLQLRYAR